MKEQILKLYPGSTSAKSCIDGIEEALKKLGVYSDLAFVGAVATVRVEVGKQFLPLSENLNYRADMLMRMWSRYFPDIATATAYAFKPEMIANRAYGNRMANGSEATGDGWKYRGRGYIQLTGKANYIDYGNKLGINLVSNPDLALEPKTGALILAQYFKDRGCITACNNKDWTRVRKLVNGGTHGLDLFLSVVNQYLKTK